MKAIESPFRNDAIAIPVTDSALVFAGTEYINDHKCKVCHVLYIFFVFATPAYLHPIYRSWIPTATRIVGGGALRGWLQDGRLRALPKPVIAGV